MASVRSAIFYHLRDDKETHELKKPANSKIVQCYANGTYDKSAYSNMEATSGPAYLPRAAKLSEDMLSFASPVHNLEILDPETGKLLDSSDHDRRFFEAAWVHKYNGKYYFSYSTGDTHYLAYAIGDSPLGPFTYAGRILEPVQGWTTHHSICEVQGKWYLFHHDTSLSGGENHLRCVKVREIEYDGEGKIIPIKR